ncbi:primosomal protein N' [Methylococcus sp. EFPC2]|uniref:primosomal protein N' n=1 Tax=Methylococcus sp. EFPC2 TaxID=2812648 RepID=UPI001966D383|nr:primosomal protein N' [Methylococcus sp. EFPC2]QSA99182.1 primosomal protein N' [Methylococcus sp. EFPC2]
MTRVLKVAAQVPLRQTYDYLPPADFPMERLQPGMRLLVPFGRRLCVGFLLGIEDQTSVDPKRLKPVSSVLDECSLLAPADVSVLRWASAYYHHPVGEVFATAFPILLRQGRPARIEAAQVLCLTEAGKSADGKALARARRQALLFQWLGERPTGVPVDELATQEWAWRPPAQALIERGWACFRDAPTDLPPSTEHLAPALALNDAQTQALDRLTLSLGRYGAFLLDGVTGSGKTEVYLQAVQAVLARGEQALILLPEISLTPQLEAGFRTRFAERVVVFHSGLSESERLRAWLAMQRGVASVMLGTRSAVFTPLRRPGLIVLDEEHDTSFKQQEGFRFSARDLAVVRARRLNIPVLLGSATPCLESLGNVQRGRYWALHLPERVGAARPPKFRVIDIRGQRLNEGLSSPLVAQLGDALARGEQALLFLNRRGYAPTLICHACGWVAECRRCDAHMVIHARDRRLRCHHCGHEHPVPERCPSCRTADLRPLGLGTERVEMALSTLLPHARVARIDRDSTRRKGSLDRLLEDARNGEIDILLGTQMLAKGHHFPKVTLVGILDVDTGFYSQDFRAGEHTAQLIMQVAGRAGRESQPGLVVLQTRHPDHPLLQDLLRAGYPAYAEAALQERRAAALPPYSYQALWRAEGGDAETPRLLLERVKEWTGRGVTGLGPAPAPLTRQAGRWRWQYLMQCEQRAPLHTLIDDILQRLPAVPEHRRVRWSVDIDPIDWS